MYVVRLLIKILTDGILKHISESKYTSKKYREYQITGLKSRLTYCLHFTSRYGFPESNAMIPFLYKKRLKQNIGKNFVFISKTEKRNQNAST